MIVTAIHHIVLRTSCFSIVLSLEGNHPFTKWPGTYAPPTLSDYPTFRDNIPLLLLWVALRFYLNIYFCIVFIMTYYIVYSENIDSELHFWCSFIYLSPIYRIYSISTTYNSNPNKTILLSSFSCCTKMFDVGRIFARLACGKLVFPHYCGKI